MSPKTTIITLLISGLLVGCWLNYYFSDQQIIRRQLVDLAGEISKEGQESPIKMGIKMGQVKKRLINPCQVVIPERNPMRPLEQDIIIRYLIYYRQRYGRIVISFENMDIAIPGKGLATVQTDIHLLRQTQASESTAENEVHSLKLYLVKEEKIWQIKQVTLPAQLVE